MASSTANAPDIVDDFDASGTEIIARDNNMISSRNPPNEDVPFGNVAKDEEHRSSSTSNHQGSNFFKKNKRMVLKIGAGALAGVLVLGAAVVGTAAVTGNNKNSSMVRSQFSAAPKATKAPTPKSSKAPKPSVSKTLFL